MSGHPQSITCSSSLTTTRESRLGTTETNVTGAQTDITTLNAGQASQNTVIAANTAQGAANNTRITDNDTDIAALQTGQAAQDTAIAANGTDIDTLEAGQTTQDAAIAALQVKSGSSRHCYRRLVR